MEKILRATLMLGLLLNLTMATKASAQLEFFGLEGKIVNSLSLSSPQYSFDHFLCAGTDAHGIYLKEINSSDSQWVNLGLEDKTIRSVHVYHWGAGPAQFSTIFVGVQPNSQLGDSTLLYRLTYGYDTTWIPSDNELDIDSISSVDAIGGFFYSGHEPPQPIFIGGDCSIYKSNSVVGDWEEAWSGGTVNIIQTYQAWDNWSAWAIWAGGETDYFAPYLVRSLIQDETWDVFYPDLGGDNACYSIAIHPENPDTVYAGMGGVVIKTTNGGQSWVMTTLQGVPAYFPGLAINPANPKHLIAGGVSNGTGFTLYESKDAGSNWIQIYPDTTIAGIISMAADTLNGEFVVYLGTLGDGVFCYRSEIVGIEEDTEEPPSESIILSQNYFNPSYATITIDYYISKSGWASIKVYNIVGQEVTVLVDGYQTNGYHSVVWDAGDTQTGVYFYQFKLNNHLIQTEKLLFMK